MVFIQGMRAGKTLITNTLDEIINFITDNVEDKKYELTYDKTYIINFSFGTIENFCNELKEIIRRKLNINVSIMYYDDIKNNKVLFEIYKN